MKWLYIFHLCPWVWHNFLDTKIPQFHWSWSPLCSIHILFWWCWCGLINDLSHVASQRNRWVMSFGRWMSYNCMSVAHVDTKSIAWLLSQLLRPCLNKIKHRDMNKTSRIPVRSSIMITNYVNRNEDLFTVHSGNYQQHASVFAL